MPNALIPGSEPSKSPKEPPKGEARLQRAERHQLGWQAVDIDGLIPLDHRARAVWDYVETLDLSAFEEGIRSVEGRAGRPAIDPAILVALWLYATLEGVGSARALERLCEEHHAYRWILGGVTVTYGEPTTAEIRSFMRAAPAHGVAQAEEAHQRGLAVVARVGGEVVGIFFARPFLEAAEKVELRAEAWQLIAAVDERHRRRGIGREGTERLIEFCFARPHTEAVVGQTEPDSPGYWLAQSLGFEVISEDPGGLALLYLERGPPA